MELKSREQILGDIVRRIRNSTDITDLAPGGALVTLLEAVSQKLFQEQTSVLRILEQTNLDNLVGTNLDNAAAAAYVPNGVGGIGRRPSARASGTVTIGSAFEKISTRPYAGKPAPYKGADTLYLQDCSEWFDPTTSPSLYIGRGTSRFEGPILYTALTNTGSHWIVTLASPLTKDHTTNDEVVLAQGGDRTISAGLQVVIPSKSDSQPVTFTVDSSAILADGEAEADVTVTCTEFGTKGNASPGAINSFVTAPFSGATVSNTLTFVNGADTESDATLRERIRDYQASLSRGTVSAIKSALLGATAAGGKTIVSAEATRPTEASEATTVYIDDGSVMEPIFIGQSYELLLANASGRESTFRTAQAPVTPVMALGSIDGPFELTAGMQLIVTLDGTSTTFTVNSSNYRDLGAATAYEIIRDFNSQSNAFEWRTFNGGLRVACFDANGGEQITITASDLQTALGFSTDPLRSIYIYRNGVLQSYRGATATLTTRDFSTWNRASGFTCTMKVDGVALSSVSITNTNFVQFGTTLTSSSLDQWRQVFEQVFPGISAVVVGGAIVLSSNLQNDDRSALEITAGTWIGASAIWSPSQVLVSAGNSPNYRFNRYTGDIRWIDTLSQGDIIEIASVNTRGHVDSIEASSGLFDLTSDAQWGPSHFTVVFDSDCEVRDITPTTASTLTADATPGSLGAGDCVVKWTDTTLSGFFGTWADGVQVGDWIDFTVDQTNNSVIAGAFVTGAEYTITSIGSTNFTLIGASANTVGLSFVATGAGVGTGTAVPAISGLYRVLRRVKNGTLVEAVEVEVSAKQQATWALGVEGVGALPIAAGEIQAFSATAIPQRVVFENVTSITAQQMIDIINEQITGGHAALLTGQVATLRTNTYRDGSVCIVAGVGRASVVWPIDTSDSTLAHTANSASQWASGAQPLVQDVIHSQELPSNTGFETSGGSFTPGVKYTITSVGSTNFTLIGARQNAVGVSFTATGAGSGTGKAVSEYIYRAYTNRSYIYSTMNWTEIDDASIDRPVIAADSTVSSYPIGTQEYWVSGKMAGLDAQVFNTSSVAPFAGFMLHQITAPTDASNTDQTTIRHPGPFTTPNLNRYSNFSVRLEDLPFAVGDKLVVQSDSDDINKTSVINMYKRAQIETMTDIATGGKGTILSLTLKDPEDLLTPGDPTSGRPFFNPFSPFYLHGLEGYNILSRGVGIYLYSVDDALVVRTASYGGQQRLKFLIGYSSLPNQAITVSHVNSFDYSDKQTAEIYVTASIPSGALISQMASGSYSFTVGAVSNNVRTCTISTTTAAVAASGFSGCGDIYYYAATAGAAGNAIVVNVSDTGGPGPIVATENVGLHTVSIDLNGEAGTVGALQAALVAGGITQITISGTTGQFAAVQASVVPQLDFLFTAIPIGSLGNGITVNVIDGGIGGLAITEGIGSVTIDLGGDISVSVADLQAYIPAPTQITFSGTGLALTATGLDTLVNGTDAATASVGLGGGADLIPGGLGGFTNVNATVVIGGTGSALPVGAWKATANPAAGTIEFQVPDYHGLSTLATVSASAYPVSNIAIGASTVSDFAAAINAYDSSIVSSEAIGSTPAVTTITNPTYVTYPNSAALVERVTSPAEALRFHAFTTKFSGKATIYEYDSVLGNLYAICQTEDAWLPTVTDKGPGPVFYSYTGEEVYVVPSNARTVSDWIGWTTMSALPVYSDVRRTQSGQYVQIASKEIGSEGAVYVKDTMANNASLLALSSAVEDTSRLVSSVKVEASQATSIARNALMRVDNAVVTEIYRPGRHTPASSSAVTTYNTIANQNAWLTSRNRLVYWRDTNITTKVRLIVAREGQFDGGEPLKSGNTFTFANLGNGLVKVTFAIAGGGSGAMTARTGDMMYIPTIGGTPFAADQQNKVVPAAGGLSNMTTGVMCSRNTNNMGMIYPGYPILDVIDANNIVILAPHMTTFSTITLTATRQVLFMPCFWAEKNILTNGNYATKYWETPAKRMFSILKHIGRGVCSLTSSNSSSTTPPDMPTYASDEMQLIKMAVNTNDWINFSDAFALQNRGTFRILGHDGKNTIFFYNPNAIDEILNEEEVQAVGTEGAQWWGTGGSTTSQSGELPGTGLLVPIAGSADATNNPNENRPIRILDAESVMVGHTIRLSSAATGTTWVPDALVGEWTITDMGWINDFTGITAAGGVTGQEYLSPWIEFEVTTAAPATNSVSLIIVGNNAAGLGIVESTPYQGFKVAQGYTLDSFDSERADLYLQPMLGAHFISNSLGSEISCLFKGGWDMQNIVGVDGYKAFGGLIQEAHKIIDGSPSSLVTYGGVKAAGTLVGVMPPVPLPISIELRVLPKSGISLAVLSESVRSAIGIYVNTLAVGQSAIESEIIATVQAVPGVSSVELVSTTPTSYDGAIVASEREKITILDLEDIVIG